jgi:acyl-coenzyme A thioesterase PaaI-like protein
VRHVTERILLHRPPPEAMRDFVSGPDNPAGMRMPHWYCGDRIEGEWTVTPALEGWAGLAQGTAFAAVHDMSAVWSVATLAEEIGFTQRMDLRFHRPMRIGERIRTVGRMKEVGPKSGVVESEAMREDGTVVSRAVVDYAFAPDGAMMERMLGRPLSEWTRAYLAAPKGQRRELIIERQRE